MSQGGSGRRNGSIPEAIGLVQGQTVIPRVHSEASPKGETPRAPCRAGRRPGRASLALVLAAARAFSRKRDDGRLRLLRGESTGGQTVP